MRVYKPRSGFLGTPLDFFAAPRRVGVNVVCHEIAETCFSQALCDVKSGFAEANEADGAGASHFLSLRSASQRRRDSCDSPDRRPASRLAMLMSSSKSGQRIPEPARMSRQFARSAEVA